MITSSWQSVHSWYDKKIGDTGDWTHKNIVIPKTIQLLSLSSKSTVLDLGCGQGILARALPSSLSYIGVDIAPSLIDVAKQRDTNNKHTYITGDITTPIHFPKQFSHAVSLLTIDNIKDVPHVFQHTTNYLEPHGIFVFVINHPCFRIPRQSSWEIDPKNKIQYRRINRYLTPLEIPITMHPGTSSSPMTWTYHFPLETYATWLHDTGFVIETIEEWTSDKTSVGKAGKMENRSRSEFPLFLAIRAKKIS